MISLIILISVLNWLKIHFGHPEPKRLIHSQTAQTSHRGPSSCLQFVVHVGKCGRQAITLLPGDMPDPHIHLCAFILKLHVNTHTQSSNHHTTDMHMLPASKSTSLPREVILKLHWDSCTHPVMRRNIVCYACMIIQLASYSGTRIAATTYIYMDACKDIDAHSCWAPLFKQKHAHYSAQILDNDNAAFVLI